MRFSLRLSSLALLLGFASAAPTPLLEERTVSILSTPEVSNIILSPYKVSNLSAADFRFLRLPHTPPTLISQAHLTAPLRSRYPGIADLRAIN
jgi:hypothetical protein